MYTRGRVEKKPRAESKVWTPYQLQNIHRFNFFNSFTSRLNRTGSGYCFDHRGTLSNMIDLWNFPRRKS